MATYIIGDLQGCYRSLVALLKKINFNPNKDRAWLTGDLINRGHNSLASLRLVYEHRNAINTVLGNHDLHLLSLYHQHKAIRPKDTFLDVMLAPDVSRLIAWLQTQPLSHYFVEHNIILTHAGVYPSWTVEDVIANGQDIQNLLASKATALPYLENVYGNTPNRWQSELQGQARARFITNAFTRMRFVTENLELDMDHKQGVDQAPAHLMPWFKHPKINACTANIAFGHWAALQGKIESQANLNIEIHALDTGCVWGGPLTALEIEPNQNKTATSSR